MKYGGLRPAMGCLGAAEQCWKQTSGRMGRAVGSFSAVSDRGGSVGRPISFCASAMSISGRGGTWGRSGGYFSRQFNGGTEFVVPSQQKAVVVDEMRSKVLGPEAMVLRGEQPVPSPARGEVLIKIAYAGVNRPDVFQRKGLYPPPQGHSETLGLEASGIVVALGEGAGRRFAVGDKVCALLNGGGYAEYATASEGSCMRVPSTMTLKEAASLPETYCTVWANVFEGAKLQRGETVLIHGGGSGIGTCAIQLCKVYECNVLTTAGTDEKCRQAVALGADLAVNYKTQSFPDEIRARLGKGKGVDVVLDMIGGEYIDKNLRLMAHGGRHISIAFLSGSKVNIDMMPVMVRNLTITGSTLRPRSNEAKAGLCRALEEHVWPLFERGTIKPIVSKVIPLSEAAMGHVLLEHGKVFGKLIMTVDASL